MVIIILLYSSLGMILFGGEVTSETAAEYKNAFSDSLEEDFLDMNFNDYSSSFFTLILLPFAGFNDMGKVNNNFKTKVPLVSYYLFIISYIILV